MNKIQAVKFASNEVVTEQSLNEIANLNLENINSITHAFSVGFSHSTA